MWRYSGLRPHRFGRYCGCLISAVLASSGLAAADQTNRDEVIVATVENDLFTGSDSNYTNGVSINWSSDDLATYRDGEFVHEWARLFDFATGFDANGEGHYLVLSLIHEMNTPTDISIADPPPEEQPYSGVLLFDTSLYSDHGRAQQAWNIRLGAVGSVTQADHAQIEYHKWIGAEEPRGWETQLPDEMLFNIGYFRSDRFYEQQFGNGIEVHANSILIAEAGTYVTALGVGGVLEFGRDLQDKVTTASLGAGLGSFVGVGAEPTETLELSTYIGLAGYGVGHYLPLDGTVFRDSRSVAAREDWVGQFGTGIAARKGNFIASFGVTFAAMPDGSGDTLDVGSISIGWIY